MRDIATHVSADCKVIGDIAKWKDKRCFGNSLQYALLVLGTSQLIRICTNVHKYSRYTTRYRRRKVRQYEVSRK